jgi:hypothetical protein
MVFLRQGQSDTLLQKEGLSSKLDLTLLLLGMLQQIKHSWSQVSMYKNRGRFYIASLECIERWAYYFAYQSNQNSRAK